MPSDPMIPTVTPTNARLLLAREGFEVDVYEPDPRTGGNKDGLNNQPAGQENWMQKGTELCLRIFPSGEGEQTQTDVGPLDTENAVLLFPADSVIPENGNRVEYGDGTMYELDAETPYSHLTWWSVREVQQ